MKKIIKSFLSLFRINRNIMEFKVKMSIKNYIVTVELIET